MTFTDFALVAAVLAAAAAAAAPGVPRSGTPSLSQFVLRGLHSKPYQKLAQRMIGTHFNF